jgi:hypothetical protein
MSTTRTDSSRATLSMTCRYPPVTGASNRPPIVDNANVPKKIVMLPGAIICKGIATSDGTMATTSIRAPAPMSAPGRRPTSPIAFFNHSIPANAPATRVLMVPP